MVRGGGAGSEPLGGSAQCQNGAASAHAPDEWRQPEPKMMLPLSTYKSFLSWCICPLQMVPLLLLAFNVLGSTDPSGRPS